MEDWQELGQAVLIGLIFAFLVAKLISTIVSFRGNHLRITREDDIQEEADASGDGDSGVVKEDVGVSEDESDEGWEGIESTELDEAFSAATAFVAATAADRMAPKVSSDLQLELYGLYKIATEGPCTTPQPSAFKATARAKWNAWQKLGAMPPEEAMQKYIIIVTELYPNWAGDSNIKDKDESTPASVSKSSGKSSMGPVFSSFVHEEESDDALKLEPIHVSAREGKTQELLSYIENGISVNMRDSEGRDTFTLGC
ncbi:acyl-CoA-binding domain-containing protein 1-like isoform X1 [Dioscorea cayenensis subsp. rotundata]|uniref:Acyl-CoA-binding domain-containing protein 1-like isoform X1 n=2 Tax=Dioscorea cayennensis subsp. rotundata TaxID=55577 RepID=A0AB40BSB8_DIOCR|nr:acyl-CoA-binding domain-containing protein 1-like isoform X1 [Dioscorea cayenensis subsp. rotundata]